MQIQCTAGKSVSAIIFSLKVTRPARIVQRFFSRSGGFQPPMLNGGWKPPLPRDVPFRFCHQTKIRK